MLIEKDYTAGKTYIQVSFSTRDLIRAYAKETGLLRFAATNLLIRKGIEATQKQTKK